MIRDEFVKTEIEEFNLVGKQMIPSKTKYLSISQYNLKKPKKKRLKGIHAVGTIRLNCLQGCPLDANKDLMKNGRSTIDYCCDRNSGIMAKKWVNYSVVNLASNYVGVEQIEGVGKMVWKGESERNCSTLQ